MDEIGKIEQKLRALEAFKDWTNYLLVTTVAALGWVSTKQPTCTLPGQANCVSQDMVRVACIWSFALSILFAILTLALIPPVAELIDGTQSIYKVKWHGWGLDNRLTYYCFPQHLLFLIGVMLYAYSVTKP